MKKLLYISVLILFLCSCGGGDEVLISENIPPTSTSLLEPTNNSLCIDNLVQFKWSESTDPNGDNITYEVQISKDNTFTQIVNTLKEVSTTVSVPFPYVLTQSVFILSIKSRLLEPWASGFVQLLPPMLL